MDYINLFRDAQKRPNAYGISGNYSEMVAFIMGCDAGNEWGLLAGFPHWLALRYGLEANLSWPAMIERISTQTPKGESLSRDDDHKISTLFQHVESFLEERTGPHFTATTITNYVEAKLRARTQDPS
ncbi:hypothetical protein J0910_30125 [Nocardiopsis sp. CNT-189]|uniref:hypothetical protein n=1 Tax=Nocardiopsis oceanisediminis TaxID=2816862 RepID=UPI003B2F9251